MLRDAGAKEVHLRITAPPIRHPCHYGIDMSTREEMVAHGREVDEIARELGADSLHYLSLEGVYEAVGATRETHCDACFTGEYPLPARARRAGQARVRARASAHTRVVRKHRASAAIPADRGAMVDGPWTPARRCAPTSASTTSAPARRRRSTAALADRDTLVVMPTGSGKSLCYQLPALMREDLTIVVSPLVSLMQDQVDQLRRIAPERVALVNAQQSAAENRAVMERAAAGELRLLYVAPERFASPGVRRAGRAACGVGLFVVDEAHCVSQWGHDFRPDYFRLADAARYLRARAIVALTATATPQVAKRHRRAAAAGASRRA